MKSSPAGAKVVRLFSAVPSGLEIFQRENPQLKLRAIFIRPALRADF
jgi:hypothetical protein